MVVIVPTVPMMVFATVILLAQSALAMEIIHTTGRPMPTPQQLKYAGGISALIHFGMRYEGRFMLSDRSH